MQSHLALLYLDRLLRKQVGQGFHDWVDARRPPSSWFQVAAELSRLTEVTVNPETVRRWYKIGL